MSRPLLGTLVMETRSEFSRPTHSRSPTGPQPCCLGAPGSPLLRGSCSALGLYTELASVPPSAARQHPAESGVSGRTVRLGVEGWDFPRNPHPGPAGALSSRSPRRGPHPANQQETVTGLRNRPVSGGWSLGMATLVLVSGSQTGSPLRHLGSHVRGC